MTREKRSGAAAAAGSSDFENLVRFHGGPVRSYILKLTGDRHTADDLSQEVFIKAFETIHTVVFEDRIRSWLFSISYHVTVDWMRRRSADKRLLRTIEIRTPSGGETGTSPVRALIRGEESALARRRIQALWHDVEELPPIYRDVVKLRYGRGWSLDAIGARVGARKGNVKVRLFRARKMLATMHRGRRQLFGAAV